MAYLNVTQYVSDVNFLESEVGLVQKTATGKQENAVLDEVTNKKLIKGGSVFPKNDATATGIVFETVDMTKDKTRPISVVVAGRVIAERLQEVVSEDAKASLEASGIVFVSVSDPVF